MDFISTDDIRALFAALQGSWPVVLSVLIVSVGAAYKFAGYLNASTISSKDAQIQLLERQVADYKDKLGPGDPVEIGKRLTKLEKMYGSEWPPLTNDQAKRLAAELKKIQVLEFQIIHENDFGRALYCSIGSAFEDAGWTITAITRGIVQDDGISVCYKPNADALYKAVSTGLAPVKVNYASMPYKGGSMSPGVAFITIGAKSN